MGPLKQEIQRMKTTARLKTIQPAYLAKREAAYYIGSSVRQLDYARARGDLAFYRLGGKVCYAVDDLQTYMQRFRVDVDAVAGGGATV